MGVRAGPWACRGLWGCPRGCPTSPSPLPALDGVLGDPRGCSAASPEPGVEAEASGAAPAGCGGAGDASAELRALAQAHPSEHHEICLAASLPCSQTSLNTAPKPPPFIPHLLILTCRFPAPSLASSSPPGVIMGPWGCSLLGCSAWHPGLSPGSVCSPCHGHIQAPLPFVQIRPGLSPAPSIPSCARWGR